MLKKVVEKFRQHQAAAPDIESPANGDPPPRAQGSQIEWIVTFCVAFAAQPIHTTTSYSEVGLGLIMCSFACLFMSKHVCFGTRTCTTMHHVGLFFGVTSFFMGTTYQCSVWLKCLGWTVYALTWIAIFVFTFVTKTHLVDSH